MLYTVHFLRLWMPRDRTWKHTDVASMTGIAGQAILSKLSSIDFPRSSLLVQCIFSSKMLSLLFYGTTEASSSTAQFLQCRSYCNSIQIFFRSYRFHGIMWIDIITPGSCTYLSSCRQRRAIDNTERNRRCRTCLFIDWKKSNIGSMEVFRSVLILIPHPPSYSGHRAGAQFYRVLHSVATKCCHFFFLNI
ncbi:hypothetical protein BDD12DRAFT_20257 [Trichophaea hybrida]|nr:hypothetical protein BDD12DRAFT_20257 [Trichophaea hybrida]